MTTFYRWKSRAKLNLRIRLFNLRHVLSIFKHCVTYSREKRRQCVQPTNSAINRRNYDFHHFNNIIYVRSSRFWLHWNIYEWKFAVDTNSGYTDTFTLIVYSFERGYNNSIKRIREVYVPTPNFIHVPSIFLLFRFSDKNAAHIIGS